MKSYFDFIPMENDIVKDKIPIVKAFPDDEIRSIMRRAIPPEWTVNLLALGKEPWKFRDLNDQLANYHQQWQSDQQKQIMINMAGKLPRKSSNVKRKK
jgi:hypothetical protein